MTHLTRREATDLRPGTPIGEYRVAQALGRGGMGTVYEAIHVELGHSVAIKVLNADRVTDLRTVARFEQEGRLVARLRHPNIVGIVTCGQLPDGRTYYVMEHLRGITLRRKLREVGALSLDEALPILGAVAAALDAAHAQGIVHRDVKPENVFLVENPTGPESCAKLLDFGVAKLLQTEDRITTVETQTGHIPGSPHYMSPEHCRGRAVDGRSDVYSLGVVAFELLCGARPFDAETLGELLLAQQTQAVPRLGDRDPQLAPLDAPLGRALDKRPEARFDRASEFVEALAAHRDARGGRSARNGAARRPAPSRHPTNRTLPLPPGRAARPTPATLTAIEGRPTAGRWWALLAVSATALVVAASLAVWRFTRVRQPASPTAYGSALASRPAPAAASRAADATRDDSPDAQVLARADSLRPSAPAAVSPGPSPSKARRATGPARAPKRKRRPNPARGDVVPDLPVRF
ncbi:MAG: protein kinase [Deltaproteobacteria bacterium]|nr:protein kinase [Deltaproteobacteria bacterium]